MASKKLTDVVYMDCAKSIAFLSYAIRKKVGCLIVKDNHILSEGCNGTVSGYDNSCEDRVYMPFDMGAWHDPETIEETYPLLDEKGNRYKLVTKPDTLHAELNAILKAAREGISIKGADMYITCSPCIVCAPHIAQVGIRNVYYHELYRSRDGLDKLKEYGVNTIHLEV